MDAVATSAPSGSELDREQSPRAVQIAAGEQHTCALLANGGVACWGGNAVGQLGLGNRDDQQTPQQIPGLTDVVEVAAASMHSCARRRNGTVACWGANGNGEIGNGRTDPIESVLRPSDVVGLTNATSLALGSAFSCALTTSELVSCWGRNSSGQLGDGTNDDRSIPGSVLGLTGVEEIAASGSTTCARSGSAGVACWGWLGRSTYAEENTGVVSSPTAITGFSGAVQLALNNTSLCALRGNGRVICTEDNFSGLGPDAPRLLELELVDRLSASGFNRCAILHDRSLSCWGTNEFGQLGIGTTGERGGPVVVPSLTHVAEIAVGTAYHACARNDDGEVRCWGRNLYGGLGDGTREDRAVPTLVRF